MKHQCQHSAIRVKCRIYQCLWGVTVLLLSMSSCLAQNGEERAFRRLSRLDGLSNEEIFSIYQDRNGIMWFGTADGLNAYDGTKFTVYYHREDDSTSLPQNSVTHIAEDANGILWVGTKDYLCRFIPKGASGEFVSYRLPTRVQFHYVRSILDAGDNRTLYIVAGAGAFAFNKRDFSVRSIIDERHLGKRPEFASRAIKDAQKKLWIATLAGVFVYDGQTNRLRRVNDHSIINAMEQLDRDGHFWYNTPDSILAFDPRTERVVKAISKQRFPVAPSILENIHAGFVLCQSFDGLIWFQYRQTIWTINPYTDEIKEHTAAVRTALNNSGCICGFTDQTGVVWLGDNVRGLAMWSPYKPKFRLWRHNPAYANSLSNDYIRGIWEDGKNTAWICTQFGGLNRIDLITSKIRQYRFDDDDKQKHKGVGRNDLWGVFSPDKNAAGQNRIWLYKEYFCQEMNTTTEKFRFLPIRAISFMLRDSEGIIWTLDTLDNAASYLGTVSADGMRFFPKKSMGNNIVRLDAAIQDRRGRLWFALFSPQVVRYDKARELWDTLRLTPPIRLADMLCSMTEDHLGNIWITTKGDGVYVFDTNDHVHNITEKDGLPNNNVYGVFEDKHGAMWFSCDKGIVRYDPIMKRFRQYTPDDGLQGWEFNRMAHYQTQQGGIYFGGTDGLNFFHPDSLRDNPHPPRVRLTAVRVGDKPLHTLIMNGGNPYRDVAVSELRSVELSHDNNTLAFDVAAVDYSAPELNKYSWKLDGFDKDWCEPTVEHTTKYTNLAPGKYTFYVRACNSDGVWNRNGFALLIVIQPAWYQRWWFYGVCAAALVFAVFGIVRVRVRAVEARNRLLEVEVHNRTKELRLANNEIQRQLEVQDEQAKEIELRNTELGIALQDLKMTQSQLVHSERMNAIGMLTAGVMHEINNPNAITYSAIIQTRKKLEQLREYFFSLLDDESKSSPEVQKYQELSNEVFSRLELAADGANRVKSIVVNLQGMTKHQEEGDQSRDLIVELTSTLKLFRMQFQEVEIITDVLPESIVMKANFGEINQVFLNLLVNAAQAGATKIVLSGTQTATMVKLQMTDNGKGMSEQTVSRVFEPFYSTKGVGNSGLGLSISKKIIERHRGTISVQSTLDTGTTFTIQLPFAG